MDKVERLKYIFDENTYEAFRDYYDNYYSPNEKYGIAFNDSLNSASLIFAAKYALVDEEAARVLKKLCGHFSKFCEVSKEISQITKVQPQGILKELVIENYTKIGYSVGGDIVGKAFRRVLLNYLKNKEFTYNNTDDLRNKITDRVYVQSKKYVDASQAIENPNEKLYSFNNVQDICFGIVHPNRANKKPQTEQ